MKSIIFVTTCLAMFLGWFGVGYNGPDQEKYKQKQVYVSETVSYIDSVQQDMQVTLNDAEQQIKSDYQDARYISIKAHSLKIKTEIEK